MRTYTNGRSSLIFSDMYLFTASSHRSRLVGSRSLTTASFRALTVTAVKVWNQACQYAAKTLDMSSADETIRSNARLTKLFESKRGGWQLADVPTSQAWLWPGIVEALKLGLASSPFS